MLKIYLIRHGKTQGNLSGKYIGARTDEPLCQEGIRELEGKNYPKAELLFVSPIMSILSAYGYPKKAYFDWQIKNGEYYVLTLEEELWKNERHVLSAKKGLWTDV